MEAPIRLDSISASLAASFRQADEPQRRRATLAVCFIAVLSVGLREDVIDDAIIILICGGNDSATVRHKLEVLSAHLDEEYFQLRDEAGQLTSEALLLFRKARAISALAYALSPDSRQLNEAVYEAISASDDETEAIRLVEEALMAR